VDRVNLEPAAQSVDALVKDAKQRVEDERDLLDKLHAIDKDAKEVNPLIQDQASGRILVKYTMDAVQVCIDQPKPEGHALGIHPSMSVLIIRPA
jgi:hypothetical protein